MAGLRGAARRHPVAMYLVLTYLLSWAVAAPLVLDARGLLRVPAPWTSLHYLMALGPITAAVVVTALTAGRAGLRELAARMLRWRIGRPWTLAAIGSPLALAAAAMTGTRVVDGTWPALDRVFEVNYLGNIGLWALPLWIVTFGYGEETGWRGFALPHIQARHGALVSALLVAVAWMGWHLPSFLYLPTYTQHGLTFVPAFFIGVALGSILLTWLYNRTGGSIFAVAVWHALFDLFQRLEGRGRHTAGDHDDARDGVGDRRRGSHRPGAALSRTEGGHGSRLTVGPGADVVARTGPTSCVAIASSPAASWRDCARHRPSPAP